MSIKTEVAPTIADRGKALRAEFLPLLLAILSVVTLEIAEFEAGGSRWYLAIKLAIIGTLISVLHVVFSRWHGTGIVPGRFTSGLLITLALLPIPVAAVQRMTSESGHTLELLLLAGFRNLVCGLAVISYYRRYDRICCVVSMFLMIFASAITSDPLVHLLVILFALCGVWWLMGLYWDSLRGQLMGSTQRSFPKRSLIAIPLLLLPLLAVLPWAAPQVTGALPGWFPSSGGDKWSDPFARSGVNDGEALVPATNDARSFGPVETDIFMESTQPSLYDVFNEMYGTPPKIQRSDRAIALSPELLTHAHERMARQQKLGKQFSTVRRATSPKLKAQQDVTSTALLYVGGRTPLHLRLEVFDLFDGVDWYPEEMAIVPDRLTLTMLGEQPWIKVPQRDTEEVLAVPESHQLKIINLQTNRIPSPSGLVGIHINKVDQVDMFAWAQDGILKMDREALPDLTVIHEQSRTVNRERLRKTTIRNSSGQPTQRQIPPLIDDVKLKALADSWCGQCTKPWDRIEAVITGLRTSCTLDRDYHVPEHCDDPVGTFLFESKRGNDYLFASGAAMLLRSLGFSTRVVSGFYADPAKYASKSRHTPVGKEDVHFWLEVYTAPGTWVTLEPTPGYDVLLPAPSLWRRCLQAFTAFTGHIAQNRWAYGACIAFTIALWHFRREFGDRLLTAWWRLRSGNPSRQHVMHTLKLLENRCRWAGLIRRPSATASRWLVSLADCQPASECDVVHRFSRVSDWARYAPVQQAWPQESQLHEICQDIVQCWTLSHLRVLRKRQANAGSTHSIV